MSEAEETARRGLDLPLNSEEARVPLSPEGWRVPSNPEEVYERLNPELMAHNRAAAKLERPKEKAALGKLQEQLVDTKPNVRLRPVQNSTSAYPEYPDDTNYPMDKLELLLMEILGPDIDFVRGFRSHLAEACTHGGLVDDRKLNFVFSAIKLQKPRDPLEVMAVAQAAMQFAANTKVKQDFDDAETPEQRQSAHRAFSQGVRTYMSVLGELKRYQTGGEQRILVQHQQNVSVTKGGQAIVGQVNHASTSQEEQLALPEPEPPTLVPAITQAAAVPMPILAETNKQPEPVPVLEIKDHTDG
jgi:FKBP-type peptidyl-prolyl cis-trans isomerase